MASLRAWSHAVPAAVAAMGAFYLVESVVIIVTAPFRNSLPMFGHLYYEPEITILTIVTALGAIAAGAVAYASGRVRALAIIAAFFAAIAGSVIAPILGQPAAWSPPPDIDGVTTPVVLLISVLVAVPGLLLGLAVGTRLPAPRGASAALLLAAGAYYLSSLLMSLPTPQLDIRFALPYTASLQSDGWRIVVVALPALAAGVVLASIERSAWKSALTGAVIGLAAAAPIEMMVLTGSLNPYVPVSLVGVPIASGIVASAVIVARRSLRRPRWSYPETWSTGAAVSVGVAAGLLALATWSLLSTMPTSADQTLRVDAYRATGDERKLVACVTAGRGDELLRPNVREDESSVTLFLRLRHPPSWYASDAVGIRLPVVISLHDPLGDRAVMDGSTGERVNSIPADSRGGC